MRQKVCANVFRNVLTARLISPKLVRSHPALEGCPYRWMPSHVSIISSSNNFYVIDKICRTIQTAVLIETLTALGAEVTWSSCVSSANLAYQFCASDPAIKEHLFHARPCCRCVRASLIKVRVEEVDSRVLVSQPLVFPCSPGRVRPRRSTTGALNRPSPPSQVASHST